MPAINARPATPIAGPTQAKLPIVITKPALARNGAATAIPTLAKSGAATASVTLDLILSAKLKK